MDMLTLFTIAGLIVIALLLIVYPLWQRTHQKSVAPATPAGQTLAEYEARYQAMLAAIKDLMFDYEMGKVSAEDHQLLLSRAKLEAANIKRQIDLLSEDTAGEIETALDDEIERLVTQLKADGLNGHAALLGEVEAELALLKQTPAGGLTCPNCGRGCRADDAFCSGCGVALEQVSRCAACGQTVEPDDAFCTKCGAKIGMPELA